nr:hypothetical protein [Staphylococcus saprophyticus]
MKKKLQVNIRTIQRDISDINNLFMKIMNGMVLKAK